MVITVDTLLSKLTVTGTILDTKNSDYTEIGHGFKIL